MVFFDENEPYWGNVTRPQLEIGNGRLSSRSVKMFADGLSFLLQRESYLNQHLQEHSELEELRSVHSTGFLAYN